MITKRTVLEEAVGCCVGWEGEDCLSRKQKPKSLKYTFSALMWAALMWALAPIIRAAEFRADKVV